MIAEVKTESCRNLRNIDVRLDVLFQDRAPLRMKSPPMKNGPCRNGIDAHTGASENTSHIHL